MIRALMLLFLCGLIPMVGYAQRGDKLVSDHRARLSATMHADTTALAGWLHPKLRYVHSNGLVEDKSDHLQHVGVGRIQYASMADSLPVSVQRWGNTALMEGLMLVSGTYEGRDFRVRLYYTAVYRKKGARWRLRTWQSTRLSD